MSGTIEFQERRSPLIGWFIWMAAATGLVAIWAAAPPPCNWLQSIAALTLLALTGVALGLSVFAVRHHRRRWYLVLPLVVVSLAAFGFAGAVARWVFFVPCLDEVDELASGGSAVWAGVRAVRSQTVDA